MRSPRARNLSTNVNETFFMTSGKPTDKLCDGSGSVTLEGTGGGITMLKSRMMIRVGRIGGCMSNILGGDSRCMVVMDIDGRDMAAMGMDSSNMGAMGMDSRGMMMTMMICRKVRVLVTMAIAPTVVIVVTTAIIVPTATIAAMAIIVPKVIIVIQVRQTTGGALKGQT